MFSIKHTDEFIEKVTLMELFIHIKNNKFSFSSKKETKITSHNQNCKSVKEQENHKINKKLHQHNSPEKEYTLTKHLSHKKDEISKIENILEEINANYRGYKKNVDILKKSPYNTSD